MEPRPRNRFGSPLLRGHPGIAGRLQALLALCTQTAPAEAASRQACSAATARSRAFRLATEMIRTRGGSRGGLSYPGSLWVCTVLPAPDPTPDNVLTANAARAVTTVVSNQSTPAGPYAATASPVLDRHTTEADTDQPPGPRCSTPSSPLASPTPPQLPLNHHPQPHQHDTDDTTSCPHPVRQIALFSPGPCSGDAATSFSHASSHTPTSKTAQTPGLDGPPTPTAPVHPGLVSAGDLYRQRSQPPTNRPAPRTTPRAVTGAVTLAASGLR